MRFDVQNEKLYRKLTGAMRRDSQARLVVSNRWVGAGHWVVLRSHITAESQHWIRKKAREIEENRAPGWDISHVDDDTMNNLLLRYCPELPPEQEQIVEATKWIYAPQRGTRLRAFCVDAMQGRTDEVPRADWFILDDIFVDTFKIKQLRLAPLKESLYDDVSSQGALMSGKLCVAIFVGFWQTYGYASQRSRPCRGSSPPTASVDLSTQGSLSLRPKPRRAIALDLFS